MTCPGRTMKSGGLLGLCITCALHKHAPGKVFPAATTSGPQRVWVCANWRAGA